MAASLSAQELQRVVHHIFLPPEVPQEADNSSQLNIVSVTLDAIHEFIALIPINEVPEGISAATSLLASIKSINNTNGGATDEAALLRHLKGLRDGQSLAAKIGEQNAAVMITRQGGKLVFEMFELSPNNEAVVATKGRLIRTFPARSVALDATLLKKADFAHAVTGTLATMCSQKVPDVQPQSRKGGQKHDEIRDTAKPSMISELFFGVLKGFGEPIDVSSISKHTRDEVMWNNALEPWRRSPMWLLVRVTLQLVTSRFNGGCSDLYKKLMVFIMSRVLQTASRMALPSDMLYIMSAKMNRRLQKLAHDGHVVEHDPIIASITAILHITSNSLSARWAAVQEANSRKLDLSSLAALSVERDTYITLTALDGYIADLTARQQVPIVAAFTPTSQLAHHTSKVLPRLDTSHDSEFAIVNLQEIERWVAEHLTSWVQSQLAATTAAAADIACNRLRKLLEQYHALAARKYSRNPEVTSVMILVIYELLIACDKIAVSVCPLLGEYNMDVPYDILQSLLLPFFGQMQRLAEVESYLCSRGGKHSSEALFDLRGSGGFAGRYFDVSQLHQDLHSKITADADLQRQKKIAEFKALKLEYNRLDGLYDSTEHEYKTVVVDDRFDPPDTEEEHDKNCTKCFYDRRRRALKIGVHEWPLPRSELEAKAVVFELQVPTWLVQWRACRQYVLMQVLKGMRPSSTLRADFQLSKNDPHLIRHFHAPDNRIGLLSESKPVHNTHYRSKQFIALSEVQVCVDNGMRYEYYDCTTKTYIGNVTFNDKVSKSCTYTASCPTLQRFLVRPANSPDGVAPNVAIASQDACPGNMTLEEFKELATLPLGHHIQWTNIMLQLAMPGVDFKKSDTALFFFQCIYQAGPANGEILRESHDVLHDDASALRVVSNLEVALLRVKENWESAQALSVFIAIASRVLSLNRAAEVACLTFLDNARRIAAGWVSTLQRKAHTATDQQVFAIKSIEVAMICASSFDVDEEFLARILTSSESASTLIQMAIAIEEGQNGQSQPDAVVALLYFRAKRLLHRAYKLIAQNQGGLHDAVRRSWAAYAPGNSVWSKVSESADHWLTTSTAATASHAASHVHLNLLRGELLVNGRRLNQPPMAYRKQALYTALFGGAVVGVMPDYTPGFEFSTSRLFSGYKVRLGMNEHGELVVRISKGTEVFETLPSRLIENAYPLSYTMDYVQWYEVSTGNVHFRSISRPWMSGLGKWRLKRRRGSFKSGWQLTYEGSAVVGLHTETADAVSGILRPLADARHIHSVLDISTSALHVDIPGLRLGFVHSAGISSLRSREYRDMEVDSDQSLGTLIGFEDKLVLRTQKGARMVLIPQAAVAFARTATHVRVNIADKTAITEVHAINMDEQLNRLIDTGSLTCKLHMAYLHALTSFCLPDPLLHLTGTEQALVILRSGAVRSFDQLSAGNVATLSHIASLSPRRLYYPAHERVMQTVKWDDRLSCLTQHAQFAVAVQGLCRQMEEAIVFFPETSLAMPCLDHAVGHLQQRDSIRSSTFRVSDFGAEDHDVSYDQVYSSRDRIQSQQGDSANLMSGLLSKETCKSHWTPAACGHLWQLMTRYDVVHGHQSPVGRKVRYDAGLLSSESGLDFVMARFPAFHQWLSDSSNVKKSRFSIVMWLSTLAYANQMELATLQVLALLSKHKAAATIVIPEVDTFSPKHGRSFSRETMKDMMARTRRECPALTRLADERADAYKQRKRSADRAWHVASEAAVNSAADVLANEWPCEVPLQPDSNVISTYLNAASAMEPIKMRFKAWHDNDMLFKYLGSIEEMVSSTSRQAVHLSRFCDPSAVRRPSLPGHIAQQDLFQNPAPRLSGRAPRLEIAASSESMSAQSTVSPALAGLLDTLRTAPDPSEYSERYVADLEESLKALSIRNSVQELSARPTLGALLQYLARCKEHVESVYGLLTDAVYASSSSGRPHATVQWPRISPMLFLQQLTQKRWDLLPKSWRSCIVEYGLAIVACQRAERLVDAAHRPEELLKELQTTGHTNWNPHDYPESLLMEVESRITIREVQEQIASQMRNPPDANNAVMQLNMGEGKSSVIVPMVAAALADGTRLVRVVVAKPQSHQMAQMLISKLGGLLNRRVFFMPFSRSLKFDSNAVDVVRGMLETCMSEGGILLVQPEHILSFELMGRECYATGRPEIGKMLVSTQDYLDANTRDIVDESDENFSVRFELIYTMGMQRPIPLSPDRWLLLQQVLELVRVAAPEATAEQAGSFELSSGPPGSFPRTRIMSADAEQSLVHRLAQLICRQGLEGFPLARQVQAVRDAVYTYITKPELSVEEIAAVESDAFWTDTTQGPLLLLRGILAGSVLGFALGQKRWRVNYGLADRSPPTKLAVPYSAKDSPTARSEFSHPDVVIVLTLLCYYYSGLSHEDLFTALGHLIDSDQADIEYQAWVKDAHDLPKAFRQLQGINLKERSQCIKKLFPALHFGKSIIDYFLSRIVFPKEMKEFPHKLSASGWDLGKVKRWPTTGFSGTNDSRPLLPFEVKHLHLAEQEHTNALVMTHLLKPENSVHLMAPADGSSSDAEHVLSTVLRLQPPVQVILDVGAQVLELNNLEMAKTWLNQYEHTKEAVVFVNDAHELCVVDRKGRVDPFQTSSFASRLDLCLVFLDDAHARGIDLRLPAEYRPAVTLGANVTKDRLVQACMRLRKLGHGQTVVFCISDEIQIKIRQTTPCSTIQVREVLVWAIAQTHAEVHRGMPLWVVQGERFVNQQKLWQQVTRDGSRVLTAKHAANFLEKEARSLEERYRPCAEPCGSIHALDTSDADLKRIDDHFKKFNALQLNSRTLQEEQERELSPEIEQERQIQRAPSASGLRHELHAHVKLFAATGTLVKGSQAYMPAFSSLHETSAAQNFKVSQLAGNGTLLVSADFAKTVKRTGTAFHSDSFQRPVQWLISHRAEGSGIIEQLMIVSPYEANQLYPSIMHSSKTALHVYKARCNYGYTPLDSLGLHMVSAQIQPPAVARRLIVQLGLFAGQLYFSNHEQYIDTCRFLGLSATATTQDMDLEGWRVDTDGFIVRDGQGRPGGTSGLTRSPVNFLRIFLSKIRKNGDGIAKTDVGRMLEGKLFGPADFED